MAWLGASFPARLASVLHRRLIDWERLHCERVPLEGRVRLAASDCVSFLEARNDDVVTEDLLFALSWVDWRKLSVPKSWTEPVESRPVPATYALLKSVLPIPASRVLGIAEGRGDGRVFPLVLAGKVEQAARFAALRLRMVGYPVVDLEPTKRAIPPVHDPRISPVRLAAALLIPLQRPERLLAGVTHRH